MRLFAGTQGRPGRATASLAAGDRAELEALHETTLGLIERLDLDELLEAIVERAGALVGTRNGYLYLAEPDGNVLTIHVGTGIFRATVGHRVPRGEGVGGRVAATGEPLVVDDYRTWEGRRPDFDASSFHAVVGVPLHAGGEVAGVIGLAYEDPDRSFGPTEVALLSRFGRLASLALENARLYADAREELVRRSQAEEELLDTVARLRRSEAELQRAHLETIQRLATAAEFRNSETGTHIERMSRLCGLIGSRLGLDEHHCELLRSASPLHDIGKIGIPDYILLKPGPLTLAERDVMERHAELGHRLLAGSRSELLELAAKIALTHHERWDGRGYPFGLAGEAIPLEGRIASVADVFDALVSARVYRPALPLTDALELMRAGRDSQFDPLVLDAFLDSITDVLTILGDAEEAETSMPVSPGSSSRSDPPERSPSTPRASEPLDPARLQSACAAAEEALACGRTGRAAIDACLAALVDGLEGCLLVSVYVLEHNRLWLIAQQGYREVLDGFSLDVGVLARAVRTGRTQFVPDVASDGDFLEATGGILAEVAVPFQGSIPAAGAFNVETIGATLPPEAETLFEPLARRLAEMLEELRDDVGFDVAKLARLCVHASSLRGVGAIAEFATRTVGRLLELECVQLDLRRESGTFHLASFWRRDSSGLEPLAAGDLQHLAFLEDETGVRAAYSVRDQRQVELKHGDPSAPWIVWLPLSVAGTEIGAVVGRTSAPPDFGHEQVEAATLFVQHTGALVDVALALRREQTAAVTDALTGLLNRRGFDRRMREELERAAIAGRPAALVMVDCDGLKELNDRGGHELGDRLLQTIGRCLRTHKRPEDVAGRIGGDEFAVLFPGADADAAVQIAERFRRELLDSPLAVEQPVAATFGVASFPADGNTPAELLRAADRALYLAKRAGGNRTLTLAADAA